MTGQTFNDGGVTTSLGFSYYRSGLVKNITDATGTRTFVYDANLQLETETLDVSFYGGRKLVRQYDAQHRPVGFTLKTGADVVELQQTHAYNGTTGLLDSVSAQQGTGSPRAFGYNYLSGTALLDTISTGTGGSLFAVSRTYETISSVTKRDLVSSIQATYGAGAPITAFDYTYRGDRRRATARQSGSAYADYGNGSAGSESTYYRYQYSFRGELTGATGYLGTDVNATTTPLSGRFFAYGYDGAGNRTTSNPTGDNETMVNGDKLYETSYQVDGLNQIWQKQNPYLPVSGTVQSAASGVAVNGFAAGKQGGHWSGEAFLANDNVPAAGLITVNAIKAGPPDTGESSGVLGVIGPDPEVLDYDADGNLTEDGLWDYVYDQRNQLIHMETKLPSGSAAPRWRLEFEYDYLGRRVQKQVTDLSTSAVTTRRYVYDGWNLVGEYAVSGGTIGALTRSYAWGLDVAGSLSATGGVGALVQLSVHDSTTVTDFYPTYDGNGNVTALVKSNGTLAAVYEYGPFGEALRVEELDPLVAGNPFRFSTKFSDVETGLIYYGHRYYSAALGRFINRDPIGEAGGLNLYAFVGNDPVNSVDVLGLSAEAEPPPGPCVDAKGDIIPDCVPLPPVKANTGGVDPTAPSIVAYGAIYSFYYGGFFRFGGPSGPGDDPTDDDSDGANDKNSLTCAQARAALVAAQNARGAYTGKGAPGWQKGQSWSYPDTGFGATVFTNSDTGQAMLAFRGTDGLSGSDWSANGGQWSGRDTPQYEQGLGIAQVFSRTYGSNGSITGHSLGGGLASLGGLVTGLNTYTFNASGLNPSTMNRNNVSASMGENIQAFYVAGEILSAAQDLSGRYPAVGNRIGLAPTLNLSTILAGLVGPLRLSAELHSIKQVISSLEKIVETACGGK